MQLAEAVLGPAGGAAMRVLTVLECYGLAICYVVLHSVNWPALLALPSSLFGGLVEAKAAVAIVVAGNFVVHEALPTPRPNDALFIDRRWRCGARLSESQRQEP